MTTRARTILDRVAARFPALVSPELTSLYALLVISHGEYIHGMDVHNAWAVWKNGSNPDHATIVPYHDLSNEERVKDDKYVVGLREIGERV